MTLSLIQAYSLNSLNYLLFLVITFTFTSTLKSLSLIYTNFLLKISTALFEASFLR